MQFVKITPVKRYHQASKQVEQFSKQYLEQKNLTLGQLLDTHFPMSGQLCRRKPGRPSASLLDIVSLPLHMIWTHIEEDDIDYTSWNPDDYSFEPLANLSDSIPTAPSTALDGPVPISSDGSAVVEQLENSESPPEDDSTPDLEPNPDSEPELPSLNQAISRKVSKTFILPFIYEN